MHPTSVTTEPSENPLNTSHPLWSNPAFNMLGRWGHSPTDTRKGTLHLVPHGSYTPICECLENPGTSFDFTSRLDHDIDAWGGNQNDYRQR